MNVEGEVFKASGMVTLDERGGRVGAVASAVGGAVSVGQISEVSDDDEQVRVGLAVSAGAAARIHWGDEDGDGKPEYGVGADIGPVSFDLKTEAPVETAVGLLFGGPILHTLKARAPAIGSK